MKKSEKRSLELIRASIGLIAVSGLLMYVSFTPDMLGFSKTVYYVILISLFVIAVALVYIVVRKFFGKRK